MWFAVVAIFLSAETALVNDQRAHSEEGHREWNGDVWNHRYIIGNEKTSST